MEDGDIRKKKYEIITFNLLATVSFLAQCEKHIELHETFNKH